MNELKGVRVGLKNALQDKEVWGVSGSSQAATNEAKSEYERATKAFIGSGKKVGKFGEKIEGPGAPRFELSNEKSNTWLSQVGAERAVGKTAALQNWIGATKNYVDMIKSSAGRADVAYDEVGIKSLIDKATRISDDAEKKLALESKVRQAARLDDIGYNMHPGTAGEAMRQVLGNGALGGIAGKVAETAVGGAQTIKATMNLSAIANGTSEATAKSTADIIAMAKTLGRVEGFANKTAKKISSAIDTMISGGDKLGGLVKRYIAPVAADGLHRSFADHPPTFETRQQAYEHRIAQLAKLSSDPVGTATALAEPLQRLRETAPKLVDSVLIKQSQIARYLLANAPKDMTGAKELNPALSKYRPPASDLAAFNRKSEAALNPLVILDKMKRGNLDPDTVETVKALYPKLFAAIQEEIVTKAAQSKKELPYKDQVTIGTLLGIPANPAMSMVQQIQDIYRKQTVAAPTNTGPGPDPSKLAKSAQTTSQRLAAGR